MGDVTLGHVLSGRGAASLGKSEIAALFFCVDLQEESDMMAPEQGPNRLNMKFTDDGRKVVIHLVRGLPAKMSRDRKTITITFPAQRANGSKRRKPEAPLEK